MSAGAGSDGRAHAAPSLIGSVCVFWSAVGFSLKAVLIKMTYAHGVDAATVLALRMLFSAPFFIAMAWWASHRAARPADTTTTRHGAGSPLRTRRDWWQLAALGFTGYYLASWLDFLGLQFVTAGVERLVLFLYPTIVVLLSALLFHERIRARHAMALALSYGGIGLVFFEQWGATAGAPRQDLLVGGSLVFASAVVYSIYLIGSARVIPRFGAVRFTAWAMLVATAVALLQFFATHAADALRLPMAVYGLSLAMAVFATVLPALLMSEGLRRVGANHAALVGTIGPVVTMVLGAVWLGEHVGGMQVVGAVLVLGGVLLTTLKPSRPASAAAQVHEARRSRAAP